MSNAGSTLDLHISGFEETVWESAEQGKDQSFTLNLTASSPDANGRMKPSAILFTKRLGVNDLASPAYKFKAGSDTVDEPITLAIPQGTADLSVRVVGDQSGSIASEQIAVDTSVAGNTTLFTGISILSPELSVETSESPVNVALYTPIKESPRLREDSTQTTTEGSINKSEALSNKSSGEIVLMMVDQIDGTLKVTGKVRSGYGGIGSMGTFSNEGSIGFIIQKGENEGSEFSTYGRADDGSVKPFSLPADSNQDTLARDPETQRLYILEPNEDRLLITRKTSNGTLEYIEQLRTGRDPSVIFLMALSRLVMVANRGDQTVSVFSIDPSGGLTPLQTVKTDYPPVAISATLSEKFVYVAQERQGIHRFSVGLDGRLTFLDTVATPDGLVSLQMSPTGHIISGLIAPSNGTCQPSMLCIHKKVKKWWKKSAAIVVSSLLTAGSCYFWPSSCAASVAATTSCYEATKKGARCYSYFRNW
jgi:DNA-binding beta-propeller fold protein YncE